MMVSVFRFVKNLITLYPTHFVKTFSKSLNTGIFPSKWAMGMVTAIPKNSDFPDPLNGRPIT